eukprot:gene14212-16804_t
MADVLSLKPKTVLVIDAGLLWNYRNDKGEKVDPRTGVQQVLEQLQMTLGYRFRHMHYVDADDPQKEGGTCGINIRMKTAMDLGISTTRARLKHIFYYLPSGQRGSKVVQADVDARIVTRIMSLVAQNELDELCLVTGDGDFEVSDIFRSDGEPQANHNSCYDFVTGSLNSDLN